MSTGDPELDRILLAAGAREQQQALIQRFPRAAMMLGNQHYVDPDPDGVTFWVRDQTRATEDEPFGSRSEANEARASRVVHGLMALAARVDAANVGDNSTDH
jgi:hypothetical protein